MRALNLFFMYCIKLGTNEIYTTSGDYVGKIENTHSSVDHVWEFEKLFGQEAEHEESMEEKDKEISELQYKTSILGDLLESKDDEIANLKWQLEESKYPS
jgi:sporulation protein YlmC with PRC-barrel domain